MIIQKSPKYEAGERRGVKPPSPFGVSLMGGEEARQKERIGCCALDRKHRDLSLQSAQIALRNTKMIKK